MGEYTKYPLQIDSTTELPKATDLVTPVKAEVVNRQRDAILAVENELGIEPSGTFSTVAARLDDMDVRIAEAATTGGGGSGGGSGEGVIASKAKTYRATNFLGGVVSVAQIITWGSTSSRVTTARATVNATSLSPSIAGHFMVCGQLTLTPTIDSVNGVLIEVLANGVTIHSASDFGSVWQVSVEKSIPFSFATDLIASDLLTVRWTHSGSASSRTQLVSGENKSWFSITRICGVE